MDHPLKSRLLPLLTLLLVLFVVFALHPLGDDNRDYSEVIDQSGTGVLNLHRRSSASPASSEELTNLTRREDYTCAAGRPCSNGACCGESGFCGYGKCLFRKLRDILRAMQRPNLWGFSKLTNTRKYLLWNWMHVQLQCSRRMRQGLSSRGEDMFHECLVSHSCVRVRCSS